MSLGDVPTCSGKADAHAEATELTNVIALSYCDKITKGPCIKIDDSKDFGDLAHLLEECAVTLRQLNYHAELNNYSTILSVFKRLPFQMQTQWLRTSAEVEKREVDPTFALLVKFLNDESEIANSVYAAALNQRSKRKSSSFFAKFEQTKMLQVTQTDFISSACVAISPID